MTATTAAAQGGTVEAYGHGGTVQDGTPTAGRARASTAAVQGGAVQTSASQEPPYTGRLSARALESHRQLPPPVPSQAPAGVGVQLPAVTPAALFQVFLELPGVRDSLAGLTGSPAQSAGAVAMAPPAPTAVSVEQPLADPDPRGDYYDEEYEDLSEEDEQGSWDDGSRSPDLSVDDWEPDDQTADSWRGLPSGSFDPDRGVLLAPTEGQAPVESLHHPLTPMDTDSTVGFGPGTSSASVLTQETRTSSGSWVPPIERSDINYLNPVSLGPFVARVLEALGQRVSFDQSVLPTGRAGNLGFFKPQKPPEGSDQLGPSGSAFYCGEGHHNVRDGSSHHKRRHKQRPDGPAHSADPVFRQRPPFDPQVPRILLPPDGAGLKFEVHSGTNCTGGGRR
jgi:hypothetical protein